LQVPFFKSFLIIKASLMLFRQPSLIRASLTVVKLSFLLIRLLYWFERAFSFGWNQSSHHFIIIF
jgi:hypothetical protein